MLDLQPQGQRLLHRIKTDPEIQTLRRVTVIVPQCLEPRFIAGYALGEIIFCTDTELPLEHIIRINKKAKGGDRFDLLF